MASAGSSPSAWSGYSTSSPPSMTSCPIRSASSRARPTAASSCSGWRPKLMNCGALWATSATNNGTGRAFDPQTKQVLAFYVGDPSRKSARKLWQRIPPAYRERATFYTDDWEAYKGVIPAARHQVSAKGSGYTNGVERFNRTLRQRVSRLVRDTLSFSKKLANHIGAIKYFICHYNQEVIRHA